MTLFHLVLHVGHSYRVVATLKRDGAIGGWTFNSLTRKFHNVVTSRDTREILF